MVRKPLGIGTHGGIVGDIPTGTGSFHGASYDLSNWGLGEVPAEDVALAQNPAA